LVENCFSQPTKEGRHRRRRWLPASHRGICRTYTSTFPNPALDPAVEGKSLMIQVPGKPATPGCQNDRHFHDRRDLLCYWTRSGSICVTTSRFLGLRPDKADALLTALPAVGTTIAATRTKSGRLPKFWPLFVPTNCATQDLFARSSEQHRFCAARSIISAS
jgi:hypothetical protein